MDQAHRFEELHQIIASGDAILFTGAGFSAEATDRSGRSLPDSTEMVRDLWTMLFGDDEQDDSTLADLYDVALMRAPDQLRDYLRSRLQIGDTPLPRTFAAWFGAPWRRIYTLNVDDLEAAVARQFELPRKLVSVSALAAPRARNENGALDVVHLNGIAGDDPSEVTFSTMQYASRLCSPDREYERLVDDLRRAPFVFVGTTLDEVVLWKHVQLERSQASHDLPRKHSFLISPALTRARRSLLDSHRIHWIPATACEIAEQVLAKLAST
ncbi:MAG TPA: SIR2 family protein [Kofleriaceae bacterium]